MGIKCFWVDVIPDRYEWRYSGEAAGACPVNGAGHRAETGPFPRLPGEKSPGLDAAPKACACGRPFAWNEVHGRGEPFYRRRDDGAIIKGKLPPGALYVTEPMIWRGRQCAGADGLNVVCVLPNGGHWYIDSRASNCTRKDDNAPIDI